MWSAWRDTHYEQINPILKVSKHEKTLKSVKMEDAMYTQATPNLLTRVTSNRFWGNTITIT